MPDDPCVFRGVIVCRSGNVGDDPEPTLARGARRVTGTAPDGEVVGADQHQAPVNASGARDEVGGQDRAEPALLVVIGEPR
jgi:hypothetical protein